MYLSQLWACVMNAFIYCWRNHLVMAQQAISQLHELGSNVSKQRRQQEVPRDQLVQRLPWVGWEDVGRESAWVMLTTTSAIRSTLSESPSYWNATLTLLSGRQQRSGCAVQLWGRDLMGSKMKFRCGVDACKVSVKIWIEVKTNISKQAAVCHRDQSIHWQ